MRVNGGTRTHDNQNHNLALYQLNYAHRVGNAKLSIIFDNARPGADFNDKNRNIPHLTSLPEVSSLSKFIIFARFDEVITYNNKYNGKRNKVFSGLQGYVAVLRQICAEGRST